MKSRQHSREVLRNCRGRIERRVVLGVMLSICGLCAGSADFVVYNIAPRVVGEEELLAEEMAEYRRLTGESNVLYSLPCAPEGKPASAKIDRHIASYRAFAAACRRADPQLKVGVLIQSVLGHFVGKTVVKEREEWQRSVDNSGRPYRWCPLDPRFRAYVKDFSRRIAAEKPCFVMTDDDIRCIAGECFCPLHAAELNRRTGLARTADEWRGAVLASKFGERDYDAYFRLQRETLEGVNALVRESIDEVDPSIQAAICMGGEEYRFAGAHARAIAAKGQRPVMRISNSLYLEHQRGEYPLQEMITRTQAYVALYENSGIRLLDEADTFPHNLWSKSATSFFSHMVAGQMCGLEGAKIWFVNAHRGGEKVTRAYTRAMAVHRGMCGSLAVALAGTRPVGVITPTVVKDSEWNAAKPGGISGNFIRPDGSWAERVFGHFGVPSLACADFSRDGIWEVAGEKLVARLSDDEIRRILSHRVLVDGKAALALARRGFADLIGADVAADSPAFNRERFVDGGDSAGRLIKADGVPTFTPRPGAKALTELCFVDPLGEVSPAAPGTLLFENSLGGTVCLAAYGGYVILYNRFSMERKRWLLRVLDALVGERFEFAVMNEQEALSFARLSSDGRTAYVAALNPGNDPFEDISIRLAAPPAGMKILGPDGSWREAAFEERSKGVFSVPCSVPCSDIGVVRVELGDRTATALQGDVRSNDAKELRP